MTTYASFCSNLETLSVTGVTRAFAAPVAKLDTAELPALFPILVSGDSAVAIQGGSAYTRTRRMNLCLAIMAVGDSNVAQDYATAKTLMDNLDAALKTLDATLNYRLSWTLRVGVQTVGGVDYRAILVEVTGQEVD